MSDTTAVQRICPRCGKPLGSVSIMFNGLPTGYHLHCAYDGIPPSAAPDALSELESKVQECLDLTALALREPDKVKEAISYTRVTLREILALFPPKEDEHG